jgi:hypothetical protein
MFVLLVDWIHSEVLLLFYLPKKKDAVAQLFETLSYKPEGRWFDSRFFIDILSAVLCPCFESASTRNQYQEYFLGDKVGRCLGLTNLPPSYAYCLEIWEPNLMESSGPVGACNGIALPLQEKKKRFYGLFLLCLCCQLKNKVGFLELFLSGKGLLGEKV